MSYNSGVIVLVISNHSHDYSLNCTPLSPITTTNQSPVVQKPINANPRLKVNQGVYFYALRCCSTLIFGKTLH